MSGKKYVVHIEMLMEYEVELDESELSGQQLRMLERINKDWPHIAPEVKEEVVSMLDLRELGDLFTWRNAPPQNLQVEIRED